MEYKDFAEAMTRMIAKYGKDVLLGDKVRGYVLDYKGQFDTEAEDFIKLLKADCARIINEAPNVLERKRQLVESMEEKLRISPKYSMPLLDLLGFLLRGDTSIITKSAEELKAEETAKLKTEAEAKAQAGAEIEARLKAKLEAEAKEKAEKEAKIRAEIEAKLRAEAEMEARIRAEVEAKLKAEAAAKASGGAAFAASDGSRWAVDTGD